MRIIPERFEFLPYDCRYFLCTENCDSPGRALFVGIYDDSPARSSERIVRLILYRGTYASRAGRSQSGDVPLFFSAR